MGLFSKRPKAAQIRSIQELEDLIDSNVPVLMELYQPGCPPCKVMEGILHELVKDFGDTAHIVLLDISIVPFAAEKFKVRSTPTFVLYGRSTKKLSKKARQRAAKNPPTRPAKPTQRWRSSGLVPKDQLVKLLVSNGAVLQDSVE